MLGNVTYTLKTAAKYTIALAAIAVGMGILAGLLVVSFDFTPHRNNMYMIIAALAVISIILIFAAIKKGRLREYGLG